MNSPSLFLLKILATTNSTQLRNWIMTTSQSTTTLMRTAIPRAEIRLIQRTSQRLRSRASPNTLMINSLRASTSLMHLSSPTVNAQFCTKSAISRARASTCARITKISTYHTISRVSTFPKRLRSHSITWINSRARRLPLPRALSAWTQLISIFY